MTFIPFPIWRPWLDHHLCLTVEMILQKHQGLLPGILLCLWVWHSLSSPQNYHWNTNHKSDAHQNLLPESYNVYFIVSSTSWTEHESEFEAIISSKDILVIRFISHPVEMELITFTFTFSHLADTFIQSDLQCKHCRWSYHRLHYPESPFSPVSLIWFGLTRYWPQPRS